MDGKFYRWTLFGIAVAICVGCWAFTFGSLYLFGHPGAARWTAMVTVSAIASEAVVWVGAFTLGWSAFASRRRLWAKLTGNRMAP